MPIRWNGSVLGKRNLASQTNVRGVWTLNDQALLKNEGVWPDLITSPTDISGCVLWLDANDPTTLFDATSGGNQVTNGNPVFRWQDKSGNANHAIASINQPTLNTTGLNSRRTIQFDGVNDVFSIADANNLDVTTMSVFVVMQRTGNGAGNDVMFIKNGNTTSAAAVYGLVLSAGTNWSIGINKGSGWGDNFTGFSVANNNPHIIGYSINSISLIGYQNASSTSNLGGGTIPTTTGTLQVGGYNQSFNAAEYYMGRISEFILYNKSVSAQELQKIRLYLNLKWSVY